MGMQVPAGSAKSNKITYFHDIGPSDLQILSNRLSLWVFLWSATCTWYILLVPFYGPWLTIATLIQLRHFLIYYIGTYFVVFTTHKINIGNHGNVNHKICVPPCIQTTRLSHYGWYSHKDLFKATYHVFTKPNRITQNFPNYHNST